jgi:flagellar protein FliT
MPLHLISAPDYGGMAGVHHLRNLQQDLVMAYESEDWARVRRLDQGCTMLIARVIAANDADTSALAAVLKELKGVYSMLIMHCHREVAAMAC